MIELDRGDRFVVSFDEEREVLAVTRLADQKTVEFEPGFVSLTARKQFNNRPDADSFATIYAALF